MNIFVAKHKEDENERERYQRTKKATTDAMAAFKKVYDGNKTTMGTLNLAHHTNDSAFINIFI